MHRSQGLTLLILPILLCSSGFPSLFYFLPVRSATTRPDLTGNNSLFALFQSLDSKTKKKKKKGTDQIKFAFGECENTDDKLKRSKTDQHPVIMVSGLWVLPQPGASQARLPVPLVEAEQICRASPAISVDFHSLLPLLVFTGCDGFWLFFFSWPWVVLWSLDTW